MTLHSTLKLHRKTALPEMNETPTFHAHRKWAAVISMLVSVALFIVKFWAYNLTNSEAVLSDALESIVNIAASLLALIVVFVASLPADENHPYGHGKVEFFSAAFEGGLITFAAGLIIFNAVESFFRGPELRQLNLGIGIVAGAGFINLALGLFLKSVGRNKQSEALVASGEHVVSDFYTSVVVVVGLLLCQWTEYLWLDPLLATLVGLHLGNVGFRLVQKSFGGLMDAEDKELLTQLTQHFSNWRKPGIIQIHHTRIIRSGRYHHIDAHVVVPEFWDIAKAHNETNRFAQNVISDYTYDGEFHFHIDPCRQAYCRICDLTNCEIRKEAFVDKPVLSLDNIVAPEEPEEFR